MTKSRDVTYSPPPPPLEGIAPTLDRNIASLRQRRLKEQREATWQERLADAITRFTGSMTFVFIHLLGFGFWIVANAGYMPGVRPWDPDFVMLAMVASVEAIFLSTFVLISQNRMAAGADKRADLDLQISLLAEHELTKVATLLAEVAKQVGITTAEKELEEVKREISPDAVLDRLEEKK
jgi:uncharacterized membrane protein